MATLDQVLAQMAAADLPPLPQGHPIIDGRIRRFGGRDKKCWYVLFEYPARNGRRYITGAFGRWSGTDNGKILVKTDFAGIEPDELRALQRSQSGYEAREREKRSQRARFASSRARQQWDAARARLAEGEVLPPYLARKRLQWENGLRVYADGTLLVPMVHYDVTEEQERDPAYTGPLRLAGLQKILPQKMPDGRDKLFNKGMEKVGVGCRFGPKPRDGEIFLFGEGLATVLSCHQVLERAYTSWVGFDAGNLLPLAKIVRALYPGSPFLFLADDDAYLEAQLNKRLAGEYGVREPYKVLDGERTLESRFGPIVVRADLHEDARGTPLLTVGIRRGEELRTFTIVNAGRTKAWEAAAAVGNAWVAWPRFAERALSIEPEAAKLTDFNDLHVAEGIGRLAEQLAAEIKTVEDAHVLARQLAAGAPAAAQGASGGGGKDGGDEDEPDWQLHGSLVRRFTLIERSDMAFDGERGVLWKVAHMRLTFGAKPVAMWLGSKRRRSVDLAQVVFDPTGKADTQTTVNLFRGIEMKPKTGSCAQLLKLARYLCGEDEATYTPVSDWVLKWCAFQVQHIGAKMKTAVVMHGPEGTGKNLFWRAMKEIFGRYAALITQAELEDKHNTWLSAKLFLIANEVVTRSEMSHHVGRLKNLVTEDEVYINPKMIDQRYERNHVNLVFCSNEFQPLKISPGDRRYLVIRTQGALEPAFYKAVAAELEAGGAAAFMQHLLELELGDFDEHTKPIATEAKNDLIEIGMLPSQLFWQEIKAELVPLPYCPALTEDVYRAYSIWCARRGHKMPEAQNRFTPAFMSMNGVRRGEPRVPDPEKMHERLIAADELRKRRVFFMGPRPQGKDEREWVVEGIRDFRVALRAYEAEGERFSGGSAPARQEAAF
jgi:putative DNA primase/helicase